MLLGLISDTHIDSPSKTLPPQVASAFKGVDLILHAGDIWISSVLDELESIAPVMATWGDDDMETDLIGDDRMIKGHTIPLNGVTIWLVHELPRYGFIDLNGELSPLPDSEARPDVVVFGHDHQPAIRRNKNLLLVNPGSVTLPYSSQILNHQDVVNHFHIRSLPQITVPKHFIVWQSAANQILII